MANRQQQQQLQASDVTRRIICGGLAGMVAKTVTNPLERIKLLSQTGEHGGSTRYYGIYRDIIKTEGILGLWAGNSANLMRVVPSKAIVFSSNDVYRNWLVGHVDKTTASFVAGGLAGMTATAVTYPLDLVKSRISGKVATDKAYTNVYQAVVVTVRDEGIAGLYKGFSPTLIGAMPYIGIQFGTVGLLEQYFPVEENNPWRKALFGGIGGITAGFVMYPHDTVRRLHQLQGSRGTIVFYRGYWDCVSHMVQSYGVARLYRGLTIDLIRHAPNSAVQFGAYELFKNLLT